MEDSNEEEGREVALADDGRPTYEADNVADWMDVDPETSDWALLAVDLQLVSCPLDLDTDAIERGVGEKCAICSINHSRLGV